MATPDDQQDPALTAGADQRPHGNLSHADLAEALVAALTQELRSVLGPRRWAVADGVHYLMGVGGLERATAEELVRHGTGRTWIVEDGQLVLPPVLGGSRLGN